ncbi:MAG: S8 family serine peptidase, partial [Actinomycetes bacterium]
STPCATTSTTRTDTIPRPGAAATRTDTVPRPDGAARDMQWALNRVQAEDAWKSSTGAGVIVAVIDTGVDANHPDLAGSLVPGFDVLRNRSSSALTDGHGHGTHVAGAIAGHGAVTGIAPDAKIMPIRAMNSQGFGTTANVVAGLIWAVNHGADVINMSLGSTTPDTAERAAIKWARGRGVLVVAAAGNDAGISIVYPAAYGDKKANAPVESDPVIGVGAVDRHGTLGYFSQIGPSVDVTAPGVRVLSTFPVAQGSYAWESGTSMAAPYVAGIVALALSYQRANSPTRTAPEMALAADRALRSSARDLGAPGVDRSYGSGDASAAGTLAALGADAWLAMPADVGLSGSSDGNATASFATPPGTEVRAVLSEGGGSEGARGETDPDGGTTLWSGPGGGAIQLPITGLTPSRAYTLTIFVTDGTHRSRAVTGLRPVTWSLKTPKTLMANTRANIAVATVLPSLGSGVPAGRITVTYRWKGHSKTVRVSPLDSAQIRLPLPRSSTNMTIRASIDGGYGNWPSVSRAYVVRIHR